MRTRPSRTAFAVALVAILLWVAAACADDASLAPAHDAPSPTQTETRADPVRLLAFLPDDDSVGDSDGTVHRNRP